MLTINNKEYKKIKVQIIWKNYTIVSSKNKRSGISPSFIFNTDNETITIETTTSKTIFENMKINTKINIKDNISDITYEDDKGWISIIDGKYNCDITKINKDAFNITFNITTDDIDEEFNIKIDENINILNN